MKKYDPGDTVTFYFVVYVDHVKKIEQIKGWTDVKDLSKAYMDFHKCKRFILKEYTSTIEDIYKILEENNHDEISIFNFVIRNDKKRKKDSEIRTIPIPATTTEYKMVTEECNSSFSSMINYSYLNGAVPYLKDKYQDALELILLDKFIHKELHNKSSKETQMIHFDQLMILFRSFPDMFGE